jgi:hypothetical protein
LRRCTLFLALLLACSDPTALEPVNGSANSHQNSTRTVAIVPDSVNLEPGDTISVKCEPRDGAGQIIVGRECKWQSLTPAIVTIGPDDFIVTQKLTAQAVGLGKVWAQSGGHRDTVIVVVVAQDTVIPPPPPADSTVNGCPVGGYLRLVNVATVSQLNAALAAALAGDQIRLAPGTYTYANNVAIVLNRSGTAANPIVVCGPRTAKTVGGVWRIDYPNKYWILKGFKVDGNAVAFTGIWDLGAGRNIFDSVEVTNTGQEGIIVKGASAPLPPVIGTIIRNTYIHHVGLVNQNFGECIYIGDGNDHTKRLDSILVRNNVVHDCPAEGIELKTGAHNSLVELNTVTNTALFGLTSFPSAVEIRGNNNRVNDNIVNGSGRFLFEVFADHVSGGLNNTFHDNVGSNSGNLKMFNKNTNAGSPLTGNVFYCDNTAIAPTLLNVTCTP